MSNRPIDGIDLTFDRCQPSELEQEYLVSAIQTVGEMVPGLANHVRSVKVRPLRPYPARAYKTFDEDELFMLGFVNAGGRYMWPVMDDDYGYIEIDYVPYVDFLTELMLHELAHAMQRAKHPSKLREARQSRTRFDKHHQEWSDDAIMLYQTFGCEKAGLFHDGMGYKSTRKRHSKMLPSESNWLWRVWTAFDEHTFGALRPEFEELFTNTGRQHDVRNNTGIGIVGNTEDSPSGAAQPG